MIKNELNKMEQDIKYPKQIVGLKQSKNGEKKTLSITDELMTPLHTSSREKSMPLEMHASGLSRFVFTLIKVFGNSKDFVFANVPADEGYYLYEKTKLAMQEILASKRVVVKEDVLSLGYTEKFTMGTFKGKTPAELLLENPNNKDNLIKQGEFLNKNAEKFPANKKMVAAIKDALTLMKEGKLEHKAVSAPTNVITIYNEPMKPLMSNQDKNGNYLVYGIKILCDTSRNLPFSIEIMNCYAPVDKTAGGTLNPRMREAVNIKKINMNFSEKDWFKTVNRLNLTLNHFELTSFKAQSEIAQKIFWENKNN